tara:strand:- start:2123 stop:2632 length:510 start_codon:yes stop_codon:yes gene_type:complete
MTGQVGNMAGIASMEDYLNRFHGGMTPADLGTLDINKPETAKAKKEILDGYSTYLTNIEAEQRINNPQDPNSFMKDAAGLLRGINQDNIDADSKRFEDALKYSREGAKTKMMMQLPGQIADIARMPGAIQLQAAQEQAKRTQDFIRSIALMDNIKTIDPGSVPNRKYFG